MNRWPSCSPAAMNAFYGSPDLNSDGRADAGWMRANLVRVKPPYRMRWSWGGDVAALTVHKACAEPLLRVFSAAARHYGSQQAIEEAYVHICGGAYGFRAKDDGSALSIHSWGAAIDFDPKRNPPGRRHDAEHGMTPQAVVDIFAAEGWEWGGRWARPDAMRFQATRAVDVGGGAAPGGWRRRPGRAQRLASGVDRVGISYLR